MKLAHESICPLNFTLLRKVFPSNLQSLDVPAKCQTILQGIRLVRSNYLRITGKFSPPSNSSEACWDVYQNLVNEFIFGFDIRSSCGFHTGLISESCKNITIGYQFETLVSDIKLEEIRLLCNRSLDDDSSCRPCRKSLSSVYRSYFYGIGVGSASDCYGYPLMYAGALANQYGPTDSGTSKCLFSTNLTSSNAKNPKHTTFLCAVSFGAAFGVFMTAALVVFFTWRRKKKWRRRQNNVAPVEIDSSFGIEMISGDNSLVKFTFEEIKKATKNFSRENIVGKGGYGNVYKGILENGSEVAFKRFKNCSAAGDATFAHEVEVIASISHVNLVAFRGYCTTTVPMEGRLSNVIDENMPELGPSEVMEKFVMVALLSTHPQLYARPTMEQIVRILETDSPVSPVSELSVSLSTENIR
ncbi:hypothetical protein COLO4_13554 [Corchorus olitorius]|uniref:Protein kinase domain-containing protein n=1 Tax=Corchorus olitorius TaxID=93759 RepID=A0A1R3JVX2_9ROSI|nr:hypothetical protein COLO4_13554 [Corchorus olitorius]